jgi:hypothetical protein
MFGFASYEELFCVLEMLSCYNSCVVSLIRRASSEMFLLLCYDSIIFLLQLFCDFAIIVQSFAMRVSGDFSGKVNFATIGQLFCFEVSDEVTDNIYFFFLFWGQPVFATCSKTGEVFASYGKKRFLVKINFATII